jgi:hypothetical protein
VEHSEWERRREVEGERKWERKIEREREIHRFGLSCIAFNVRIPGTLS